MRVFFFTIQLVVAIALLSCSAQKAVYYLPFAKDSAYRLIQGWDGRYGHSGHLNYAYDFLMPTGSPVLATRGGRVIKVEEGYEDNTKTLGKENYIIIDHGDSTYGRYYHLTKNGVLVRVGEQVKRKQLIGRSGNSGASAGPHLHFDVSRNCFDFGCQTISFAFKNSPENPLLAGKEYKATK